MSSRTLSGEDEAFIREAALFLEDPGAVLKGLNWIGARVDSSVRLLPPRARALVHRASRAAIEKAFAASLLSLGEEKTARALSFRQASADAAAAATAHIAAAAASGAIGGIFGLAALPVELPVATVLMLRGIAETARIYGYDLREREVQLECIYVFSMGGEGKDDDSLESSYYSSRIAFAELARQSAATLGAAGARELLSALERGAAPVVARMLGDVASRFELRVLKKTLAQGAPLLGALGGAGINAYFASYFHACARYHFGLRRLEKERGYEATRAAFEAERARIRAARAERA